jgi:uncharacterized protein (TIGR02757 family)
MDPNDLRARLDRLYDRLNRRICVHPDPLELVYQYTDTADREIVALIAASLAYGRVEQILLSVGTVLNVLGPLPRAFLLSCENGCLHAALGGFRHRFTGGDDLARLLAGARGLIRKHGSLDAALARHVRPDDRTIVDGLGAFAGDLADAAGGPIRHLLASPRDGSACKRLHLFLRWMVRSDAVDPGGWTAARPDQLVVPVDVHMHRVARRLSLTQRRSADLRAALEITEAFRAVAPDDPVRYDFALTRLGIRGDARLEDFFPGCAAEEAAGG